MPLATAGLVAAARVSRASCRPCWRVPDARRGHGRGRARPLASRDVNPGGLAVFEGPPARGRARALVSARPAGPARGSCLAVVRGLLGRPETAIFLVAVAANARLRARARAHGPAEQLGLPHVPPGASGGLGAARRRLLDPERAHRPHQRVPAARRAADLLPLRRDEVGCALRAAAVRVRARDPRRRLRGGAAARVRRALGLRVAPARDLLAARPAGDPAQTTWSPPPSRSSRRACSWARPTSRRRSPASPSRSGSG